MNRRVIDKKESKILFNDSPEDELNYILNFDSSSDDDNLMKPNSEVIWSKDLFEYPDSFESFSDLTGRTFSSCSWHNDDFDMKSTNKVNASLEAIDNALFERIQSCNLNESVFQECCDWAEKFPYFRVKGEQMPKPMDCSSISHSIFSENIQQFKLRNSSASLHLEGRKLPLHTTHKLNRGAYFDNVNDGKVSTYSEDVKETEEFEEYLVLHKSDNSNDNAQCPAIDYSKRHSPIKALQETVIDLLVSEMWPSVLSFLENLNDKKHSISDFQLPPIINSCEEQKILCLQRPKTEGGVISTEFPKLENILSVSPKVLQKRHFQNGCINRISRPNSEMSVNLRTSSKSVKSVYHNINSTTVVLNCNSSAVKEIKKESENVCLMLPALEEDFQDCSSILRGFHIEPERKEVSQAKSILPAQNESEPQSTSRENEYFLPPIENRSYIPSNIKLTQNLFTFYGPNENKRRTPSSKYKKHNSRPNTSLTKKTDKNCEVTHQFTVNNGLYITAKNLKRSPSNYEDQNLELAVMDSKTDVCIDASQEKSVTLFPIVTSLIPHEEKNTVKKGLRTFLRGKKR